MMEGISLGQQIAAVKREIAMRKTVYPGLVMRKKMPSSTAAFETQAMEAVLATLQKIEQCEPLSLDP